MKSAFKSQFLIFILFLYSVSITLAQSLSASSQWRLNIPASNVSDIVITSDSGDVPDIILSTNNTQSTIHIIPVTNSVFEETLLFSGQMLFSTDSETTTLLQEYDDKLDITTIKIITSTPVTLYCHGDGYFIDRKSQPNLAELPSLPSQQGNQLVFKKTKYNLVVIDPVEPEIKTSKRFLNEFLQGTLKPKLPYFSELGRSIMLYPQLTPGRDPGKGKDRDRDGSGGDGLRGKPCPNCKSPPCPRCNKPHCLEWMLIQLLRVYANQPQEFQQDDDQRELHSMLVVLGMVLLQQMLNNNNRNSGGSK